MNLEIVIGFIGGFLTSISNLPQVLKCIKTKSTNDISWGMLLISFIGVEMWLIYGIMILSWPLIIFDTSSICMIIFTMFLKYKYDRRLL